MHISAPFMQNILCQHEHDYVHVELILVNMPRNILTCNTIKYHVNKLTYIIQMLTLLCSLIVDKNNLYVIMLIFNM